MTIKEIRKEMKDLKKEMKESGMRITSCFNGGLTRDEYRCNSRLFQLKTELAAQPTI